MRWCCSIAFKLHTCTRNLLGMFSGFVGYSTCTFKLKVVSYLKLIFLSTHAPFSFLLFRCVGRLCFLCGDSWYAYFTFSFESLNFMTESWQIPMLEDINRITIWLKSSPENRYAIRIWRRVTKTWFYYIPMNDFSIMQR
jgi:hypothetical protein